jgi:hypothetical protein
MTLAAQGLANVEMLSRSDPFLELARLQVGVLERAASCCKLLRWANGAKGPGRSCPALPSLLLGLLEKRLP